MGLFDSGGIGDFFSNLFSGGGQAAQAQHPSLSTDYTFSAPSQPSPMLAGTVPAPTAAPTTADPQFHMGNIIPYLQGANALTGLVQSFRGGGQENAIQEASRQMK